MKRIVWLTLFFYSCTFAAPPQSQSAIPLALVAAAAIGATMVSTSAGTYYAQTGQAPQYVKTASSALASAADAVFQPSYLAQAVGLLFTPTSLNTAKEYYAAKAAAVGASLEDILNSVNDSATNLYSDLKALIASHTSATTLGTISAADWSATYFPSSYWLYNDSIYKASGTTKWTWLEQCIVSTAGTYYVPSKASTSTLSVQASYGTGGAMGTVVITNKNNGLPCLVKFVYNTYYAGKYYYDIYYQALTLADLSNPVTYPPVAGAVDYPGLATDLAAPSDAVAKDLRDSIAALPDAKKKIADSMPATAGETTTAPSITAAEVAQLLKDNASSVAQAAAEAAQTVAAANPTDAAAQIAALQASTTAAQAAAEAAQNAAEEDTPKEETFSAITDSPFQTAYNPGAFDIPTRFSSFLQTVKLSGVFSFSSAYFNSLPGGGSSSYTINAGRYGTHTVDLSDTMSTGLAVLKSILLACFGFLSIRAIIMKR